MRFTKMQGVGNDFVVLDAGEFSDAPDWAAAAVRLCDRRFGVGADGLLVLHYPVSEGSFGFRMFNPDGSEDMCGNGLRCAGLYAHRAGWLTAGAFDVATKDGPRAMQVLGVDGNGRSGSFRVDMGQPHFAPHAIPFCVAVEDVQDYPLRVGDRTFLITPLNTGSTHTVIFGEPPTESDFQTYSPLIENHPLFPQRTSVLWATPTGENILDVRIWERGAGETLGCGTGACAVGVAAVRHGLSRPDAPTTVVSKGGALLIDWPGGDAAITMTGPARFVFEGEI